MIDDCTLAKLSFDTVIKVCAQSFQKAYFFNVNTYQHIMTTQHIKVDVLRCVLVLSSFIPSLSYIVINLLHVSKMHRPRYPQSN